MKSALVVIFVLVLLCMTGIQGRAQQVFKTTSASVIAYLEYLPQDYDVNSDKYPIVIFLHGIGEKGPNTTDTSLLGQYINDVTTHGPPKHVKNGAQFPFILISPQLKSNYSTWPSSYVREVLDHCMGYLRIDERRIYVTGLSLGGGGAWVAAQDLPELFAAVAPVCGGYNSPSKACGIASENLPVWAFHGDKDTVVPLSKSQNMVNAINECSPQPSPQARLTVYSGVAHNAWDYAYKTDNSLHTPNVYEWLMSFTNAYNDGNKIPVANAGPDKASTAKSLTLAGSGSDADGLIASYSWKKLSGPAATLSNVSSSSLSLSNLQIGTYLFSLRVSDNAGATDTDYIKVTVSNAPPVANAGADKQAFLPSNAVTITGSATDSDGAISSYQWSKVSGPGSSISGVSTSSLSVDGLLEGDYVFRLVVKDDHGATDSDDMVLKVTSGSLPVVKAGSDKLVRLPTTSATIFGSATDPDGKIVSYQWTKVSGANCVMSNTTSATLKLTGLTSGVYEFRLTAKDNTGNCASDDVRVTVDAPPVANAGPDKTITLPLSSSLILSGSATDPDGTISRYVWSKYSGPSLTVSNSTTPSLTISKVYEGTYVFKLAVTDNLGVTGYDYVNVTVNAASSSARMSTSGESNHEMDSDQTVAPEFAGLNSKELEGNSVIIFSSSGEKVFSGPWSPELHSGLLKTNVLYFYNVVRNGRRIGSGKVFKRDI